MCLHFGTAAGNARSVRMRFMGSIMSSTATDFRNTPAPTDWLEIHASKLDAHAQLGELPAGPPTSRELLDDFLSMLGELRCYKTRKAREECMQSPGCVCALADQLADLSGEWIAKADFAQALAAAGYSQEEVLSKYRIYAEEKLALEAETDLERLFQEKSNAYNWKMENTCIATIKAYDDASRGFRARLQKIRDDLEKITASGI